MMKALFLLIALITCMSANSKNLKDMVSVPSGTLTLFILEGGKAKTIPIESFLIDRYPVTNIEFLKFTNKNSKWQKGKAPALFADKTYLKHWKGHDRIGSKGINNSPVVYVSWFAAKAYCEVQGKTLPTSDQWEYVAQMTSKSESKEDLQKKILTWYSKPTRHPLANVGSAHENPLGVFDLHGLVWEWTLDFNSNLVTGESREDSSLNRGLFCGSGSLSSNDKENYPAFMRFAFRSSLKGQSSIGNLGFRCVHQGE